MILSLVGLSLLFLICFLGVPLGYGMLIIGTLGFAYIRGSGPAMEMAGQQIIDLSMNYNFSTLPLFVLMGAFVHRAKLSDDLYEAANAWLSHWRGGLAMTTIAACAGFSAVSGSSLATAATMSKVAMPPMRKYRYSNALATGSIAAGGTLGIMIPPSVPMVIYGILTDTDIGKLFVAGIVPGLLLVVLFILSISVLTFFWPEIGPSGPRSSWSTRWKSLLNVWGILALFLLVLGGIYLGIFTPTEAAGIGAIGAMFFAWIRGRLSQKVLVSALVECGVTTAMIFVVAFGAMAFSNFVAMAGLTGSIVSMITAMELSPLGVVLAMCLIYLIMGSVFDSLSMMLLTIPVFSAILNSIGVDLIWFGIVAIIVIELGLITPPIGMNVFVVKSVVKDVELWTIFSGVWPFVIAGLVALGLVLAFPGLALWLPSKM
ncbi:MAG: TRAP transporter large permease [Nitratireductor sp.]